MVAQVIPLRRRAELTVDEPKGSIAQPNPVTARIELTGEEELGLPIAPQVRVTGVEAMEVEPSSGQQISTEQLYPGREGLSSELDTALRLLAMGEERVQEALMALRNGEPIPADHALQRLQAMLPELFCLRELGDGFGMIVNALIWSFQNLDGSLLGEPQVRGVAQALKTLRTEPFTTVNAAVDLVTCLENIGFVTEPPQMDILADLLSGDESSDRPSSVPDRSRLLDMVKDIARGLENYRDDSGLRFEIQKLLDLSPESRRE